MANFEGRKVNVKIGKRDYVGWVDSIFNDRKVLLRDVMRDDGERISTVLVNNPNRISKVNTVDIRCIDIDDITPITYDVRQYKQRHDQDAIRQQLKSGHLFYFPLVREHSTGEFEVIDGFYRVERARMLGYSTIPAKVVDFDDLTAARFFVQEHVPLPDERPDPSHNFESQQSFIRILRQLNEDWPFDILWSFRPLAPELEKLIHKNQ
ncbi:ParB-like nuclease domain-containing protein [Halopelagius longus]|nr:ParB-like nuclease domain-containing protein [Halopelagius longus]